MSQASKHLYNENISLSKMVWASTHDWDKRSDGTLFPEGPPCALESHSSAIGWIRWSLLSGSPPWVRGDDLHRLAAPEKAGHPVLGTSQWPGANSEHWPRSWIPVVIQWQKYCQEDTVQQADDIWARLWTRNRILPCKEDILNMGISLS